MKSVDVTDKSFEEEVLCNDKPVLLQYWAEWCQPCKLMAPVFEEIASNYGFDLAVRKLNIDENPVTVSNFSIRGIPTLMLFQERKVQATHVGVSNYKKLSSFIDKNIYFETEENDEAQNNNQDEFLGIALIEGALKIVGLTPDGKFQIKDNVDQYHKIIHAYSLENLGLERAIEELEDLINDRCAKEQDFQDFFERNEDFIMNDEYKCAHSKIILERDEEGPLIPDFVMQPINQSSLCDLLELKTPDASVFVLKKNRLRFSAAVMEAAAQLREYSIYFDEKHNREKIHKKYGLQAYKPKMVVILGRSGSVSPIERKRAATDLANIELRTYDDILERAKFKLTRRGLKNSGLSRP